MIEQIKFCNVVLLNTTDVISLQDKNMLSEILKWLNPRAKILESSFGKIDVKEILNTNLFNKEKASQSPGWIKELSEEHIPG